MRTLRTILALIISLYALSVAEASPFKGHYQREHIGRVHDHSTKRAHVHANKLISNRTPKGLPIPPDMYRA